MLAIFDTQINSIESELTALLAKVEEHRQQLKEALARQRKTTKLIDNLKGLIEELPGDAIANLRESILSLFPGSQLPATDNGAHDLPSASPPLEKLPIIAAIEEIQKAAEPLTAAGMAEEQTSQSALEKPATDIPIATAPDQLENAFSQVPRSNVTDADATGTSEIKSSSQPEVEVTDDAITTEDAKTETPAAAINEFCSLIKLNETVAYIRKNGGQSDGEIMSAYVGCSSQKLASDWADCVKLWGAEQTEVRKPQRLIDAKWEVKIWGLPFHKLARLAEFHKSLGEPVPGASHSIEEAKKLELNSPNSEEISGDSSDMNSRSASEDAEIIAAGELAKEELGLAEAPTNDTPMQGDFVRIVSGHYAGLSGKATVMSRRGGIIETEHGNRWVSWNDCEVTQKTLIR